MVGFTIGYIDKLLEKYGPMFPRRTEIKTFSEVEVRKVAISNLTVGFDKENGFLGHQVKADEESSFSCSEYDKILLIHKSGMYKVINVIDKLYIGSDVEWVGLVDEKIEFNIVYRDGLQNISYVKRFQTPKFILEKEYYLFTQHKNSIIQHLDTTGDMRLRIYFVPAKRSRTNSVEIDFDDYLVKGVSAIGKRISTRVVKRLVPLKGKKKSQEEKAPISLLDLPGKKEKGE